MDVGGMVCKIVTGQRRLRSPHQGSRLSASCATCCRVPHLHQGRHRMHRRPLHGQHPQRGRPLLPADD
jgi:hypothetical protein